MKSINDPKVAMSWCLALVTLLLSDLFWGLPVCAQIVNDGATATLNHITNTISGSITVGTNGPFRKNAVRLKLFVLFRIERVQTTIPEFDARIEFDRCYI